MLQLSRFCSKLRSPPEPLTISILAVATRGLWILTVYSPETTLDFQTLLTHRRIQSLLNEQSYRRLALKLQCSYLDKTQCGICTVSWTEGFCSEWPQGELKHRGILQQGTASPGERWRLLIVSECSLLHAFCWPRKPRVSSSEMDRKMANRKLIRLSQLKSKLAAEKLEEIDWVTFGVIIKKVTPQSTNNVSNFIVSLAQCTWNAALLSWETI